MSQDLCFLQDELIPYEEAKINISDSGLLYGDGLFETIRVYRGVPFKLREHLKRLEEGAGFLGIPIPYGLIDLPAAAARLLQANGVVEGSLRITLTRGPARRALWPAGGGHAEAATLLMTAKGALPYQAEHYRRGYRAVTVSFPRNQASPLVAIKSLNFLENVLARREAAGQGCDEGIFLNTKGEVAEGASSNVFVVSRGELVTPSVVCGLLPGITRQVVLSLAEEAGIKVKERILYPEDLEQAEEAFLTASLMEIMPLVAFEGKFIGDGKPGNLTLALIKAYRVLTGR